MTGYFASPVATLYQGDARHAPLAAQRLGRRSAGMELSEAYLAQAQRRLEAGSLPLREG